MRRPTPPGFGDPGLLDPPLQRIGDLLLVGVTDLVAMVVGRRVPVRRRRRCYRRGVSWDMGGEELADAGGENHLWNQHSIDRVRNPALW